MTVAELIECLESFDADIEVYFSHPSHDYWGTQLATSAQTVDEGLIIYSDYHKQDKIVELDEDGEIPDGFQPVIIIS